MRKVITFLLAAAMLFTLAACGSSGQSQQPAGNDKPAAAEPAAEPTPEPTEAPTPEPTEAPTPEPSVAWETVASGVNIWGDTVQFGFAWIQVKNTGDVPLYLNPSHVDLERSDGTLYKSLPPVGAAPQVLLPGETGAYGQQITVDDPVPEDGLRVVPMLDIQPAKVEAIRLDVSEFEIKEDGIWGITAQGRVHNNTDEPQKLIRVAALLYDADGNYLGTMETILSGELPADAKIGFDLRGMGKIAAEFKDVASWEVYAYPNQYQF